MNAAAKIMPFSQSAQWFQSAGTLWLSHPVFFGLSALAILLARFVLDFGAHGTFVLFSYFTDALLFSAAYLGLKAKLDGTAPQASLRTGWKAMEGRRKAVFKAGLWGIPSAGASYLIFILSPEIAKIVATITGSNWLAGSFLVVLGLGGVLLSMMLLMLSLFAAIKAAEDGSSLKTSGLWASRALLAGWKPLVSAFGFFIAAAIPAAAILVNILGHLPGNYFIGDHADTINLVSYWMNWPGLFVALNVLLALIYPMAQSMMGEAKVELGQASEAEIGTQGNLFVAALLDKAGYALRIAAGLYAVSIPFVSDSTSSGILALVLFLWGRAFRKSAQGWIDGTAARYAFVWIPVVAAAIAAVIAIMGMTTR